MAITLIDGFDLYNGTGTGTGLQSRWVTATSLPVTVPAGRFGGQCVRLGANASSAGTCRRAISPSIDGAVGLTLGFAFRTEGLANTRSSIHAGIMGGGNYQCGMQILTTGAIELGRYTSTTARTALGTTSSGIILENTWHYIEMEIVVSNTVGRMTLFVDGTQVLNLTGLDNLNTSATIDEIVLMTGAGTATVFHSYDDLYVTNTATRLGERRVETLRPAADTAQKDFARSAGSDNFALVDETTSNGDTDYVQGSTVGNLDRYTIGALSSTPSAISAVQLTAFALKTDAATRNIALHCQSGATDSDGPNYALAASYTKFDRILETDPATSAAWTSTGVNSLLIGPKVTV